MLTDTELAAIRKRLQAARSVAGPFSVWLQLIDDCDALCTEVESLQGHLRTAMQVIETAHEADVRRVAMLSQEP